MTHSPPRYTVAQRCIAVVYGVVCHTSFALSIGLMMLSIGSGFWLSQGTLAPPLSLIGNTLLLMQFPLLHSLLLSQSGRRWMAHCAPLGLGADLSTTIYATLASWQLLLTFLCWTPSGHIWWQATGSLWYVLGSMYLAAWLLLLKTMVDAGLAVQTGALGWLAVARGEQPRFAPFRPRGTFRYIRQPIYVAFALTLWTTPVWTPDGLVLALVWTVYCLLGPLLKERRYARWHGAAWQAYRARVPYWLPHFGRSSTPRP